MMLMLLTAETPTSTAFIAAQRSSKLLVTLSHRRTKHISDFAVIAIAVVVAIIMENLSSLYASSFKGGEVSEVERKESERVSRNKSCLGIC